MKNLIRVLAAATVMAVLGNTAASAEPTCSEILGIANHGQHIVGDYVTGTGRGLLVWPPAKQVGVVVKENGGAFGPGGPGAGGHLDAGIAPGASFCNTQSQSPGVHLGLP